MTDPRTPMEHLQQEIDLWLEFSPDAGVATALEQIRDALVQATEALEPFAGAAGELDDNIPIRLRAPDGMTCEDALWRYQQPTVGDFRRSRYSLATLRALSSPPAEQKEARHDEALGCPHETGDCYRPAPTVDPRYPALLADAEARQVGVNLDGTERREGVSTNYQRHLAGEAIGVFDSQENQADWPALRALQNKDTDQ